MKRIFLAVGILLVLLSGILLSTPSIETLVNWSFQYNESTNDYSIFFGLRDDDNHPKSADVNVDIRIVNDENEEVYTGTKKVSTDDFNYYTDQAGVEQHLAEVRIPAEQFTLGKSSTGKVYLTVYKENIIEFDEVNCQAINCLPIKDVQVTFDTFPLELRIKNFMGGTASIIQIQGAEYKFDKIFPPQLSITVTGEKISDTGNLGADAISYKLYDSAGYMIDSGNLFLPPLNVGDKFKDDSIVIYGITPGEIYSLHFTEYE